MVNIPFYTYFYNLFEKSVEKKKKIKELTKQDFFYSFQKYSFYMRTTLKTTTQTIPPHKDEVYTYKIIIL